MKLKESCKYLSLHFIHIESEDEFYYLQITTCEKRGGREILDYLVETVKSNIPDVLDVKAQMDGEDFYSEMQLRDTNTNPISWTATPVKLE